VGKDLTAMCFDLQQCQRGKVHKQPAAPLHAIPVPARRFSHVHVDLVGPLTASSEGHVHLLTVIDRSIRWVEAVPLRNMEASLCMDAFITNWVACFGMPTTVTTRVSPYRFKFFFACKRNKANLDPFHLCFTISL
jgi:hypothetical protein